MSGFQEILLIVLLIVVIFMLPRMTGNRSARRPSAPILKLSDLKLSGQMRAALAAAFVYVALAAAYFEPWKTDYIIQFALIGIGPIVLIALGWWVYAGFKKK